MPVLEPQNDVVTHRQALLHKHVAAAIETVRDGSAQPAVRLAFEYLVLTAARSGEVRLATWDEIDTAGAVWTVPAARMRAKREHRVPLCGRAPEVLDAARALGDSNRPVFPMRSGRPIARWTFPKMLQYHEVAAVPHGFRSSFRDWAAEETVARGRILGP
ncbi:MAG: tyrosine-type recombinase/integrase [Acidobacteria bacterium]|nr:tyrosine-type recombinase/integrase [Acidobacteriota bacterium]